MKSINASTFSAFLLILILGSCSPKQHSEQSNSELVSFEASKLISTSEVNSYDDYSFPSSKTYHISTCLNDKLTGERLVEGSFTVSTEQKTSKISVDSSNGCLNWTHTVNVDFSKPSHYIKNKVTITGENYFTGNVTIHYEFNPWSDTLPQGSKLEFYDLRFHDQKSVQSEQIISRQDEIKTSGQSNVVSIGDAVLETNEFENPEDQTKNFLKIKYKLPVNYRHVDISGKEFLLPISSGKTNWVFKLAPLIAEPVHSQVTIKNSMLIFEKTIEVDNDTTFGRFQVSMTNADNNKVVEHNIEGDLSRSRFELSSVTTEEAEVFSERLSSRESQQPKDIKLESATIHLEGKENWLLDNNLSINLMKSYTLTLQVRYKTPTIGQSGPTYQSLPDGKYRIGISFLKKFHDSFSIDPGHEVPFVLDGSKLHLDVSEQEVEVKNGEVYLPINLTIPDVKLLTSRSLMILDLFPINQNDGQVLSRFILESILEKKSLSVYRVARSNQEVDQAISNYPEYANYLAMSYEQLRSLQSEQSNKKEEQLRKVSTPQEFATFNNVEYVDGTEHRQENLYLDNLLQYSFSGKKILEEDIVSLCQYWSKSLYRNLEADEEKNLDNSRKINVLCNYLSRGNINTLFHLAPVYFNPTVLSTTGVGKGQPDLHVISHAFSSNKLDIDNFGIGGSAEIPFPISMGVQITKNKQAIIQESTTSTNQYILASEMQKVEVQASKIQPCLIIRPNLNLVHRTTVNYSRSLFNWSPKVKIDNRGIIYCGKTRHYNQDKPIRFQEKLYFISQKFQSEMVLDATLLKNQPWLLQLRGENQFNNLMQSITLEAKESVSLDDLFIPREYMNPTDRLGKAFQSFKDKGMPTFPGLHYLRPEDLQHFQETQPLSASSDEGLEETL